MKIMVVSSLVAYILRLRCVIIGRFCASGSKAQSEMSYHLVYANQDDGLDSTAYTRIAQFFAGNRYRNRR